MILIVCSVQDIAGINISERLREEMSFTEVETGEGEEGKWVGEIAGREVLLVHRQEDILYCNNLEKIYSPDLIIFASRHSSATGEPTLCVHVPGNFGEAKYGGEPKTLQATNANLMRNVFLCLLGAVSYTHLTLPTKA